MNKTQSFALGPLHTNDRNCCQEMRFGSPKCVHVWGTLSLLGQLTAFDQIPKFPLRVGKIRREKAKGMGGKAGQKKGAPLGKFAFGDEWDGRPYISCLHNFENLLVEMTGKSIRPPP